MLPEAKEGLYVLMNTPGTIREEHKTTSFHEVVAKQEGDKQRKGVLHADCRKRILQFYVELA